MMPLLASLPGHTATQIGVRGNVRVHPRHAAAVNALEMALVLSRCRFLVGQQVYMPVRVLTCVS